VVSLEGHHSLNKQSHLSKTNPHSGVPSLCHLNFRITKAQGVVLASFSDTYWIPVSGIKLLILIQWHPRNHAMPSEWVSSSFSQFKFNISAVWKYLNALLFSSAC
jgi:hypothetical protein